MVKPYLSRKESIILSAIDIIDELGTQGLTIREIAARQKVTEAAIYKHFTSKSEIVSGVLDKFSQFDIRIAAEIREKNVSAKEEILLIASSYAEYYKNYPALTAILFTYDTIRSEPGAAEKMRAIFNNRYNFIAELVEKGQECSDIKSVIPKESFADIIIGAIESAIFRWRMNNYDFDLKVRIMQCVEAILNGC